MIRINLTALIKSVLFGLLFLTLLNPTIYQAIFGERVEPMMQVGFFPLLLYCAGITIYPLAGFYYGYIEDRSGINNTSIALGGAITGGILFIQYILVSLAATSEGLMDSFQEASSGLQTFSEGGILFGVIGSLLGLGYATAMFASFAAGFALISHSIKNKKKDRV